MRAIPVLLVPIVLGCGAGGDDASTIDGATDVDGASETVRVTVHVEGAPAAGIAVMIHDADGAYLRSESTGADGVVAIADFPEGGAVTAPVSPFQQAIETPGSEVYLTTILGVELGDDLVIGLDDQGVGATEGALTTTYPAAAVGGATFYQSFGGCSVRTAASPGSNGAQALRAGCMPGGVVDTVVYAQFNADRLAYDDAADVAVTGTAPDLAATVVFDAWKSDLASHTITATGGPEAGTFKHGAMLVRDGVIVESLGYADEVVGGAGDVVGGEIEFADQFYDRFLASVEYARDSAPDSYGRLYLPGAQVGTNAEPATTSISLAADIPAPPTVVDLTTSITYTAPAWSCADDSTAPAAAVAVRFRESGGKGGPGDFVFHQWYLVAAGDVASGTAWPELDPAVIADLWPGGFIGGQDSIRLITDDGADWDAMRGELDYLGFGNPVRATAGIRCVGGIELGIAPSLTTQ